MTRLTVRAPTRNSSRLGLNSIAELPLDVSKLLRWLIELNAAYAAASRGEILTIKIGRLLRVPVRALEKMLDRAGEAAV